MESVRSLYVHNWCRSNQSSLIVCVVASSRCYPVLQHDESLMLVRRERKDECSSFEMQYKNGYAKKNNYSLLCPIALCVVCLSHVMERKTDSGCSDHMLSTVLRTVPKSEPIILEEIPSRGCQERYQYLVSYPQSKNGSSNQEDI